MLLLLIAKSLHKCFWSPSFDDVSNGPSAWEDVTRQPFYMSPRHGAERTSHNHPKLHLLTICVVSSTYPNSSNTRAKTVCISDTLNHLHLLLSPYSPSAREAAKKQNPQQQYVTGTSFAPSAHSPCTGPGQVPLPPAVLTIWHELEVTSIILSQTTVDTCHRTGQAKMTLI